MIRDITELSPHRIIEAQDCVIGAGPSGIVIALLLARAGRSVVLLESGPRRVPPVHDLDRGEVVDPLTHGPLEHYRRRGLGGATAAWGGRAAPFDPQDFQARRCTATPGWPISYDELMPWYAQAATWLDLPQPIFDRRAALAMPASLAPLAAGVEAAADLDDTLLYRFSPPVHFGQAHYSALAATDGPNVLTGATIVELRRSHAGGPVVEAVVRDPRMVDRSVRAERFIVAAGGLESTRILLLSRGHDADGLGNASGHLGRHYMCHNIGHLDVAFRVPDTVMWDYETATDGGYVQRTLRLTPGLQESLGVLNHRARLEHADIADAQHSSGVLSASFLTKQVVATRAPGLTRGLLSATQADTPIKPHIRNMMADAPATLAFTAKWVRRRILARRKLPSIALRSGNGRYVLRFDAEQSPSPASRVGLSPGAVDALGLPRMRVEWHRRQEDAVQLEAIATRVSHALVRSGAITAAGTWKLYPEATGGHHLGTARMSAHPGDGVVDANLRVHDTPNVYVASSAAFPTSSYANPTMTVLALALRLVAHLSAPSSSAGAGAPARAPR